MSPSKVTVGKAIPGESRIAATGALPQPRSDATAVVDPIHRHLGLKGQQVPGEQRVG